MAKYKIIADNLRFKKKRYNIDDEIELTDAQAFALVNKVARVDGERAPNELPPEKVAKAKSTPRKKKASTKKK